MRPIRSACLALLCALIALPCFGQAADPYEALYQGGTETMTLEDARRLILTQNGRAVPRLVEKLKAAGTSLTARINIGATLAPIARDNASATLKEGLLLCTGDDNPGVRYWGLRGLAQMQDVEPSEIAKVIDGYLEADQPEQLKLLAADTAGRLKVKAAVPKLIALLRASLPAYLETRQTVAEEVFLKERTAEPGAPRRRETEPTLLPGDVPGLAPGMEPPGAEQPGEEEPETPRLDLNAALADADPAREKELAETLEARPEVMLIRRVGSAIETITQDMITAQEVENRKDQVRWQFLKQPPWKLEESVLTWVGWYGQNRAKFEGGE